MSEMRYEEKQTIVHSCQAALLYSDGLVEAHDPMGEMFGFPRLRALLAEHSAEEERLVGDSLMEELYSFVGEDHPSDASTFLIPKLIFLERR